MHAALKLGRGSTHSGFFAQAEKFSIDQILTFLRREDNMKVIFTGHSKGSAVAELVTYRLLF